MCPTITSGGEQRRGDERRSSTFTSFHFLFNTKMAGAQPQPKARARPGASKTQSSP